MLANLNYRSSSGLDTTDDVEVCLRDLRHGGDGGGGSEYEYFVRLITEEDGRDERGTEEEGKGSRRRITSL